MISPSVTTILAHNYYANIKKAKEKKYRDLEILRREMRAQIQFYYCLYYRHAK